MKKYSEMTEAERDDLSYSDDYAAYIMEHAGGMRVICNGDTLLEAMEDGFLFDEFIESIGGPDVRACAN